MAELAQVSSNHLKHLSRVKRVSTSVVRSRLDVKDVHRCKKIGMIALSFAIPKPWSFSS